MPMLLPEPPKGSGRLLAELGLAHDDRPAQCRTQVVKLELAPLEPGSLLCAGELCLCLQGEVQEILAVTTTGRIELALSHERFLAELPNRLEHGKPWVAVRRVDRSNQRLVHQRR